MNIPTCPWVAKGRCTTPRPKFVNETDEGYLFFCEACENFYGYSKDFIKKKARYQNEMNHLKHESEVRNAVKRRAVYSK